MSTTNVLIKLDTDLVQKLTLNAEKLVNCGSTLVFNPNVRGEVMALIVSWSAFHRKGQEGLDAEAAGGQYVEPDKNEKDDIFMQFVLNHSVALLVELAEATITLELWSLFELCCKTMAKLIAKKTSSQVEEYLNLNGSDCSKVSRPVIEGFLKYLTLKKRLELDTIELKEWQVASHAIWSQQKVLFFGHCDQFTTLSSIEKCNHGLPAATEFNSLNYFKSELSDNIESIKTSRRRKMPDKFLQTVEKCMNLETIVWDTKFGEMADTKLARVLDQNCPHLEHVQGTVKKEYEFEVNGKTCLIVPTSFIDLFEPSKNTTCYNVVYQEDMNIEPEACPAADAGDKLVVYEVDDVDKVTEELMAADFKLIGALGGHIIEHIEVLRKKTKVVGHFWYLIGKPYFKKMYDYMANRVFKKSAHPGPVDNRSLWNPNYEYVLKDGLIENTDYILVPEDAWKFIVKHMDLINGHAIKRLVYHDNQLKQCYVELYNVTVHLASYDNPKVLVKKWFSHKIPYSQLLMEMKKIFGIDKDCQARLWVDFKLVDHRYYHINERVQLFDKVIVSIEIRQFNGRWPSDENYLLAR